MPFPALPVSCHSSLFAASASLSTPAPSPPPTVSRDDDDARHCPRVTSWLPCQRKLCLLSTKLTPPHPPLYSFLSSFSVLFLPAAFQTNFVSLAHWQSFPLSLLHCANSCPDALLHPTSLAINVGSAFRILIRTRALAASKASRQQVIVLCLITEQLLRHVRRVTLSRLDCIRTTKIRKKVKTLNQILCLALVLICNSF